jgi:hypothetical protein
VNITGAWVEGVSINATTTSDAVEVRGAIRGNGLDINASTLHGIEVSGFGAGQDGIRITGGLHVAGRSETGLLVKEYLCRASNVSFDDSIIGKRKGLEG